MTSGTDTPPAGGRVALWGAVVVLSPVVGGAAMSLAYRLGHDHIAGTDTTTLPWLGLPLLAAWGWWLHHLARANGLGPRVGVTAALIGVVWAGVAGLLATVV